MNLLGFTVHDNGHIIERMGHAHDAQSSEWYLVTKDVLSPHKCGWDADNSLGSELFSAISGKTSCLSEDGQLQSGCLHQLSRWHTLSVAAQTDQEKHFVEQHETVVCSSDSHTKGFEHMSRSALLGELTVWGVETPSWSSGTDVAEVQQGCCRPLHLIGKPPMSAMSAGKQWVTELKSAHF